MEDIIKIWPALASLVSMIAGGVITWTTTKVKIDALLNNHQKLEGRVDALEKSRESERVSLADRLARLEVKLDAVHIKLESK